jgi:hypothetical protein
MQPTENRGQGRNEVRLSSSAASVARVREVIEGLALVILLCCSPNLVPMLQNMLSRKRLRNDDDGMKLTVSTGVSG